MKDSDRFHFPQAPIDRERKTAIERRKKLFADLNIYVTERRLTSIPGDLTVTLECLVDSPMPDDVARLGYDPGPDGETMRILPAAIEERFTRNGDGTLSNLTEGSTQPVAEVRRHPDSVRPKRFSFSTPERAPQVQEKLHIPKLFLWGGGTGLFCLK
jgi:hypothetical protein